MAIEAELTIIMQASQGIRTGSLAAAHPPPPPNAFTERHALIQMLRAAAADP